MKTTISASTFIVTVLASVTTSHAFTHFNCPKDLEEPVVCRNSKTHADHAFQNLCLARTEGFVENECVCDERKAILNILDTVFDDGECEQFGFESYICHSTSTSDVQVWYQSDFSIDSLQEDSTPETIAMYPKSMAVTIAGLDTVYFDFRNDCQDEKEVEQFLMDNLCDVLQSNDWCKDGDRALATVDGMYSQVFLPTEDIQEIANQVKEDLEHEFHRFFWTYDVLEYREQVVAGTNYLMMIQVSDTETIHVVVYEPFPYENKAPEVLDYAMKGLTDPLDVFQH